METARASCPDVVWCEDTYEAMEGADAMVVLTEWNAFRALDLKRVRRADAAADGGRSAQCLRPAE